MPCTIPVMPTPFEPDHDRYHHSGCCDAHVVTSARCVALTSLVFLLFRTLLVAGSMQLSPPSIVITLAELLCIFSLLYAVYKSCGPLVVPYLLFQIFVVLKILYTSFLQFYANEARVPNKFLSYDSKEELRKFMSYDESRPPKGVILLVFVGRLVWIGIIAYFFYIIVNYFLFLRKRTAAFKEFTDHGASREPDPNAYQTIFQYQIAMAPTQHQVPQYQHQAPVPIYQQYHDCPHRQGHIFEPPPPYEP